MRKKRRLKKVTLLVFCCIIVGTGICQDGDNLFNDAILHEIKMSSTNNEIFNEMVSNHEAAFFGGEDEIYSKLKLSIDGNIITDSVGVRCKGETSFSEIGTNKKPFKIDFNKFSPDQKYDDLKKINLHNARADASLLRDKICYDLFRAMGVNAPRVSFAKVYINDEYWGLYSIVEQVDKTYLKNNFGNKDGNLYKSVSGGSIAFSNMELKTNKTENDFSKLNTFIDKINNTPEAEFEDTIRKYLNIDKYLTALAIDVLILDIDKYWHSGKNFYLYENSQTGKFEWIPWDYNLAMNYIHDGTTNDPNYKKLIDNPFFEDKPLIKKILANENLKEEYIEKICLIRDHFNTTSLFTKIDNIKTLIEADVILDPNYPYTDEQFSGNIGFESVDEYSIPNPVPGIKQFITDRSAYLANFLSEINFDCNGVSSIYEPTFSDISIYPNPVGVGQTINIDKVESEYITLFDLSGRVVLKKELSGNTLQLPADLNAGVYIYRVDQASGRLIIH